MTTVRDPRPDNELANVLHNTLHACQRAADAHHAVSHRWPRVQSLLPQSPASRIHVLATGKASVPMLQAALANLAPEQLGDIIITCPPEHANAAHALATSASIRVFPCDHPLPTLRNVVAAQHVLTWTQSLPAHDTLLVLLSGGASAHLCLPAEGITLDELTTCTRALQRAGATIRELNAVRKHAELLKGGQLARACTACQLITCILSDVLPHADGSPALDTIASGPTVPDATTFADALAVLRTHNLLAAVPALTYRFQRGIRGELPETPKSRDDFTTRTYELIVGDNTMMLEAAAHALREQGIEVISTRSRVEGDAAQLGCDLVAHLHSPRAPAPTPRTCAALIAGEWTVNVGTSTGIGGPSQELALAALLAFPPNIPCALLAYSSDGIDGPTPAAGALVTSDMLTSHNRSSLAHALTNHDAHTALAHLCALITTGPTGTNVNHIAVLLWQSPAHTV